MDRIANMPGRRQHADLQTLVQELRQGHRAALSRLLTLAGEIEDKSSFSAALDGLPETAAPIIAITGSAGVGKSSLLGALAAHFAARGERVGVLACDPTSPVTGGALLGDRCRIAGAATTDRIFIRSLAANSGDQGIAKNITVMLSAMKRFGFERIFVETVGTGQGDVAVRRVADIVVLVIQPQAGDDLQWEKAGILEIADVVVVNKADLPGADRTIAEVSNQLHSPAAKPIPVLATSVARNQGIEELCRVIDTVQEGTS